MLAVAACSVSFEANWVLCSFHRLLPAHPLPSHATHTSLTHTTALAPAPGASERVQEPHRGCGSVLWSIQGQVGAVQLHIRGWLPSVHPLPSLATNTSLTHTTALAPTSGASERVQENHRGCGSVLWSIQGQVGAVQLHIGGRLPSVHPLPSLATHTLLTHTAVPAPASGASERNQEPHCG